MAKKGIEEFRKALASGEVVIPQQSQSNNEVKTKGIEGFREAIKNGSVDVNKIVGAAKHIISKNNPLEATGLEQGYEAPSHEYEQPLWQDFMSGVWNSFIVGGGEGLANLVPTMAQAAGSEADVFEDWKSNVSEWFKGQETLYSDKANQPIEEFGDITAAHTASALGQGVGFILGIMGGGGAIGAVGKGASTLSKISSATKLMNATEKAAYLAKNADIIAKAEKGAKISNRIGSFMAGTTLMYPSIEKEAKEAGLSNVDASRFALGVSGLVSMTEGAALEWIGKIATKPLTSSLTKEAVRETLKNSTTKNPAQLQKLFLENYTKKIGSNISKIAESSAVEFGQEFSQTYIEEGAKQLWDTIYDKKEGNFGSDITTYKTFVEATYGGIIGGLIGGGLGATHIAKNKLTGQVDSEENSLLNQSLFGYINTSVQNKNTQNIEKLDAEIDILVNKGEITKEEAVVARENIASLTDFAKDYNTANVKDTTALYQLFQLDGMGKSITEVNDKLVASEGANEVVKKAIDEKKSKIELVKNRVQENFEYIFEKGKPETKNKQKFDEKLVKYKSVLNEIAENNIDIESINKKLDSIFNPTVAKKEAAQPQENKFGKVYTPTEGVSITDAAINDKKGFKELYDKAVAADEKTERPKLIKEIEETYGIDKESANWLSENMEYVPTTEPKVETEKEIIPGEVESKIEVGEVKPIEGTYKIQKEIKDNFDVDVVFNEDNTFEQPTTAIKGFGGTQAINDAIKVLEEKGFKRKQKISELTDEELWNKIQSKRRSIDNLGKTPNVFELSKSNKELKELKELEEEFDKRDSQEINQLKKVYKEKQKELRAEKIKKQKESRLKKKKKKDDVVFESFSKELKVDDDNNTAEYKGKKYTIIEDEKGSVLHLKDRSGKILNDENLMVQVEILRDRQGVKFEERKIKVQKLEETNGISLDESKVVDTMLEFNLTDEIADLLNDGVNENTTNEQLQKLDYYIEDLLERLHNSQITTEYSGAIHDALIDLQIQINEQYETRESERESNLKNKKDSFNQDETKQSENTKEQQPTEVVKEEVKETVQEVKQEESLVEKEVETINKELANLTDEQIETQLESNDKLSTEERKKYSDELARRNEKAQNNAFLNSLFGSIENAKEQRNDATEINDNLLVSSNPELYQKIKQHFAKIFPHIPVTEIDNLGQKYGAQILARLVERGIEIDPNKAIQTSLIHEYAHIYLEILGDNHPLVKLAYGIIEGSQFDEDAKRLYPDKSRTEQLNEALTEAIATNSLEKLQTKFEGSALDKFLAFAKRFWNRISRYFGLSKQQSVIDLLSDQLVLSKKPYKFDMSGLVGINKNQLDKSINPKFVKLKDLIVNNFNHLKLEAIEKGTDFNTRNEDFINRTIYGILYNQYLKEKSLDFNESNPIFSNIIFDNIVDVNDIISKKERTVEEINLAISTLNSFTKQLKEKTPEVYSDSQTLIKELFKVNVIFDEVSDNDLDLDEDKNQDETDSGKSDANPIKSGKKVSNSVRSILSSILGPDGKRINPDVVFSYVTNIAQKTIGVKGFIDYLKTEVLREKSVESIQNDIDVLNTKLQNDKTLSENKIKSLKEEIKFLEKSLSERTGNKINPIAANPIAHSILSTINGLSEPRRNGLLQTITSLISEKSEGISVEATIKDDGTVEWSFKNPLVNKDRELGDVKSNLEKARNIPEIVEYFKLLGYSKSEQNIFENESDKQKLAEVLGKLFGIDITVDMLNAIIDNYPPNIKTGLSNKQNFKNALTSQYQSILTYLEGQQRADVKKKVEWKDISGFIERMYNQVSDYEALQVNYLNTRGNAESSIKLGHWASDLISMITNKETGRLEAMQKSPIYKNNSVLKYFADKNKVNWAKLDGIKNLVKNETIDYSMTNSNDYHILQAIKFFSSSSTDFYKQSIGVISNRDGMLLFEVPKYSDEKLTKELEKQRESLEQLLKKQMKGLDANGVKKLVNDFNNLYIYKASLDGNVSLPSDTYINKEVSKIQSVLKDNGIYDGLNLKEGDLKKYFLTESLNRIYLSDIFSGPALYHSNPKSKKGAVESFIKRMSGLNSNGSNIELKNPITFVVFDGKKEGIDVSDSFSVYSPNLNKEISDFTGSLSPVGLNSKNNIFQIDATTGKNLYVKASTVNSKGDNLKGLGDTYAKIEQALVQIEKHLGNNANVVLIDKSALKGTESFQNITLEELFNASENNKIEDIAYKFSAPIKIESMKTPFNLNKKLKSVDKQSSIFSTQAMQVQFNNNPQAIEKFEKIAVKYLVKKMGGVGMQSTVAKWLMNTDNSFNDLLKDMNDRDKSITTEILSAVQEYNKANPNRKITSFDNPSLSKIYEQYVSSKLSKSGIRIEMAGNFLHQLPDIENELAHDEVAVPWAMFADSLEKANELLRKTRATGNELKVAVVRIPASAEVSMFAGKVKYFLDTDANVVKLSNGFVKSSGSDHDGDKAMVYRREMKKDGTFDDFSLKTQMFNEFYNNLSKEQFIKNSTQKDLEFDQLKDWVNQEVVESLNNTEQQITPKENIKPGVPELFESNPELEQSVYEALGFGQKRSLPTSSETINIYAGDSQNAELSNFAIRPFTTNVETPSGEKQYTFQSVEQGFHFYKALVANNPQIAKQILATTSGGQLKKLTNRSNLPMTSEQVKEWDDTSKSIMLNLMYDSYEQNPKAAEKLLATGNAKITHTQDNTRWKTDFPEVVMTVRDMLKEEGFDTQFQITPKENIKPGVKELFESNPELEQSVYEALGFNQAQDYNNKRIVNKLTELLEEADKLLQGVSKNKKVINPLVSMTSDKNLYSDYIYIRKESEKLFPNDEKQKILINYIDEISNKGENLTNLELFNSYNEFNIDNELENLTESQNKVLKSRENVINLISSFKQPQITPQQKQQAQQIYSQYLEQGGPQTDIQGFKEHVQGKQSKKPVEVEKKETTYKSRSINDVIDIAQKMGFGGEAVGRFAIATKLMSLLGSYNAKLNTPIDFRGEKLTNFSNKQLDALALLLQSALDIGNDPILAETGFTSTTIDVGNAMLLLGVNPETVINLLKSSEIQKLNADYLNKNSVFNLEDKQSFKEFLNKISKDAFGKNLSYEELVNIKGKNVADFLQFQDVANDLSKLISFVQSDKSLPNNAQLNTSVLEGIEEFKKLSFDVSGLMNRELYKHRLDMLNIQSEVYENSLMTSSPMVKSLVKVMSKNVTNKFKFQKDVAGQIEHYLAQKQIKTKRINVRDFIYGLSQKMKTIHDAVVLNEPLRFESEIDNDSIINLYKAGLNSQDAYNYALEQLSTYFSKESVAIAEKEVKDYANLMELRKRAEMYKNNSVFDFLRFKEEKDGKVVMSLKPEFKATDDTKQKFREDFNKLQELDPQLANEIIEFQLYRYGLNNKIGSFIEGLPMELNINALALASDLLRSKSARAEIKEELRANLYAKNKSLLPVVKSIQPNSTNKKVVVFEDKIYVRTNEKEAFIKLPIGKFDADENFTAYNVSKVSEASNKIDEEQIKKCF